MEVTCNSCSKKITIPAEKVPKNAAFSFNCPSCKNKITVQPPQGAGPPGAGGEAPKKSQVPSGPSSETFTAESGVKGAMICHPKPEKFKKVLGDLGYGTHAVSQHIAAINNLRFNDYKVIIVTNEFEGLTHDGASILETLTSMNMSARRSIFLVYVTPGVRSYDFMQAFAKSVNMLVTPEDAEKDGFGTHLERGVKENDNFFKVLIETLVAQGKV